VRRKACTAVLGLTALSVVVATVVVLAGALSSHNDKVLGHWSLWATVAVLAVTAVGVLPQLWDSMTRRPKEAASDTGKTADELAAVLFDQATLLIGTDVPGDKPANVRFAKCAGRFREVGGAAESDLASVLEYYQLLSPGRLVVLGEPGAGKTVLALELQLLADNLYLRSRYVYSY
jgi:hypothetical protein